MRDVGALWRLQKRLACLGDRLAGPLRGGRWSIDREFSKIRSLFIAVVRFEVGPCGRVAGDGELVV